MSIGRLRNDNGEGSENSPSYQNEGAFFINKNSLAFISTILKW